MAVSPLQALGTRWTRPAPHWAALASCGESCRRTGTRRSFGAWLSRAQGRLAFANARLAMLCLAPFCTPGMVGSVVILPSMSHLVQLHHRHGSALPQ
jgi:hypothetical protein